MAKIKLAAPLSGIRGKLGASVFSANKSGPYLKNQTGRVAPRFPKISEVQNFLSGHGRFWNTIGIANRALWDAYAALAAQDQIDSLGNTYSLSGWQWFVKLNNRTFRLGSPRMTVPPVAARPGAPTITTFIFTSISIPGADTRVIYPAATFAGINLIAHGALAFGTGRLVPINVYTPFAWIPMPGATSQSLHAEWESYFGPIQIGQVAHLQVFKQDNTEQRGPATTKRSGAST